MSAFRFKIALMNLRWNIGTPEIIFVLQLKKYINTCKGVSDPEHE